MIKSIGSNIHNIIEHLNTITVLTDMLDASKFVAGKPDEQNGIYIFVYLVTDVIVTTSDPRGSLIKEARLQFRIMGDGNSPKKPVGVSMQNYLYQIIDAINQEIVDEGCTKIPDWNGFKSLGVIESSISPIFTPIKNRPYLIKDYIFTYLSK